MESASTVQFRKRWFTEVDDTEKEELKVDDKKADTRVSSGETRRKGGPCGLMTGRVGESDWGTGWQRDEVCSLSDGSGGGRESQGGRKGEFENRVLYGVNSGMKNKRNSGKASV